MKHVYNNETFEKIIQETVDYFDGTPIEKLPPESNFRGTGVYALYYMGDFPEYKPLAKKTKTSFSTPIYVGKAVPKGWRQARVSSQDQNDSTELCSRVRQHFSSVTAARNLSAADFRCRYMVLAGSCSDMIGTVEAALIKKYQPLWNSVVDGFGNHDPGKGRYNQAKSDWDVLHPGRRWADKCMGTPNSLDVIKEKIEYYMLNLEE